MNITFKKYIGITALILSLILVCYPRFNRQDIGPIQKFTGKIEGKPSLGDSPHYTNYVNYFRGDSSIRQINLPFLYRPLAPLIASLLPIKDPMTAINVLNVFSLYVALVFLFFLT
jgi:hypothetical protein